MVQIREFRVVLPMSVEEYRIAQLYMVAKYSAAESGGDGSSDGVEILQNEPFANERGKGQYTHKVYHLASKLPSWIVSLLPKTALMLDEEAWNSYPRCVTVLKCPYLSKFKLQLETMHLPDRGDSDNALELSSSQQKKRQVEMIDIATDPVEKYIEEEDPCKFKSQKTGRGPLKPGWHKKCKPVMTAYKLVTVDVPYFGWGSSVEKFVAKHAQRKVLLEGHRKAFCWLDEWYGLTMDDIRAMEKETAAAMLQARGLSSKRMDQEEDAAFEDVAATQGGEAREAGGVTASNQVVSNGIETPGQVSRQASTSSDVGDHGRLGRQLSRRASRDSSAERKRGLSRRTSFNSAGPSFSMGIATNSASEDPETPPLGEVPPMPCTTPRGSTMSLSAWKERLASDSPRKSGRVGDPSIEHMPSIPSFAVAEAPESAKVMQEVSAGYESEEVRNAILQLDYAIELVKGQTGAISRANGKEASSVSTQPGKRGKEVEETKEVEHCVSVLDKLLGSLRTQA